MEINLKNISKKLHEQEDGTEVGKKIVANNDNPTILNFEGVTSVNTAFFNAMLSAVIKKTGVQDTYSNLFKFKNASPSIVSMFALSLNYSKYAE